MAIHVEKPRNIFDNQMNKNWRIKIMRCFAFYFAVALLAFGFSLFFVTKFYWIIKEPNKIKEKTLSTETQKQKNIGRGSGSGYSYRKPNEPESILKLHKPTCTNKKLFPVWKELVKDKEFKERAAEGFYREADCRKMLNVKKIDLNSDGEKEIILEGNNLNLCQRDNCLFWIFERKGKRYKQILQTYATGSAYVSDYIDERGFKIGETKSFGYKTITAKGGRSALAVERKYQFDGNQYRETECLTFEYQIGGEQYMETCEEKWKE